MRGTYSAALRVTMRNTAAAHGYTLSTAATLGVLSETAGSSVATTATAALIAAA